MLYKAALFLVEVDEGEEAEYDCVTWEWSKNFKG